MNFSSARFLAHGCHEAFAGTLAQVMCAKEGSTSAPEMPTSDGRVLKMMAASGLESESSAWLNSAG